MHIEETEATLAGRAKQMRELHHLLSALQGKAAELPHLKGHTETLETRLHRLEELIQLQATLKAARKEGTQRLAALMSNCERLATVLRFELKLYYGRSAEKLKEFGIQPRPTDLQE